MHMQAMILIALSWPLLLWIAWDTFKDWPWTDKAIDAKEETDSMPEEISYQLHGCMD